MLRLFIQSSFRALRLLGGILWPFNKSWPRTLRGTILLAFFLPLLAIVQLGHWLGFLLDEIFFRGYRHVEIREPVFVLGVPRSGTTHLHTTLSDDPQYTTFSAWECFFGLSVSGRKFWRAVAKLDRAVGRPLTRLVDFAQRKLFAALNDIHPMKLGAAEEDYFAFTPLFACFILIVPFPFAGWLWAMGYFDRDMADAEKKRLIRFYHRCIQKHLFANGPEKRFLSKNASFAGMAHTLLDAFPDGRFMVCVRDPHEVVPSQLSSIEDAAKSFGYTNAMQNLNARLIDLLNYYYENLANAVVTCPDRMFVVTQEALKTDLENTIHEAYTGLQLPMSYQYRVLLGLRSERSRAFHSSHTYTLDRFGLSDSGITARFGPVFHRLRVLARSRPDKLPVSSRHAD